MNEPFLRQGRVHDLGEIQRKERKGILVQSGIVFLLILVLGLFLLVLLGNPHPSHPSSFEKNSEGFYGVYKTLEELGGKARRNRKSFPYFFSRGPAPPKSSLLIIDPFQLKEEKTFKESLLRWVEKGGNLLVTEPGFQRIQVKGIPLLTIQKSFLFSQLLPGIPDFTWMPLGGTLRGKGPLKGLVGSIKEVPGANVLLPASVIQKREWGMSRDDFAAAKKEAGDSRLGLRVFTKALEPWSSALEYRGHPILLQRKMGQGKIFAGSTHLLFSNFACAKLGTGRAAMRALLLVSEGRRRTVFFDEWSHGLGLQTGFWAFFRSKRLLFPALGLLLLYVVLIWRGLVREGPVSPKLEISRRSKEEWIHAQAQLLVQGRKFDFAGRLLFEGYDQLLQIETGMREWPGRRELVEKLRENRVSDERSFRSFGRELLRIRTKNTKTRNK